MNLIQTTATIMLKKHLNVLTIPIQTNQLTIVQLSNVLGHDGVKVIHRQQKPYFEF